MRKFPAMLSACTFKDESAVLNLFLDLGFDTYKQTDLVLPLHVPQAHREMVRDFVESWCAHAQAPSELYVDERLKAVERIVLTQFGKPTEELDDLAEDIKAQGIATSV